MKTKTKIAALMIMFAALIITTPGCQKYPDGPMFSIHSRTERVANTWRVDNYKVNDDDYTSLVAGYTETYSKDGNFSFSWGNISGTGKWAFQNNDTEIRITGTS